MTFTSLPDVMVEPLVRTALNEDLGLAGDVTSDALIPENHVWNASLVARTAGVLAGLDFARLSFTLFDPRLRFEEAVAEGAALQKGDRIAKISGSARSILTAERTVINFLSRLSGIASLTRCFVEAARPHKAKIVCTRKTTPGHRMMEKYAVRVGGGFNHRLGLDDAILIKDNHIAVVGDIRAAVIKAKESVGHMVKVSVEVDTLEQLRQIVDLPLDAVLLDNMTPEQLAQAVQIISGRFIAEASGGVSLENVNVIAATGVDVISVGALTHSAPSIDIGLDAGL